MGPGKELGLCLFKWWCHFPQWHSSQTSPRLVSSHTPVLKEPLVVYQMGIGVFTVVGCDCALGMRILPSYNLKLLPFLEFVVFCFCKML